MIAYNALAKATAAGTINFYPETVQQIVFDGPTAVITFSLAAQNTSGQTFNVKSLAGNLYANNYLIGNASYFYPQVVGPNRATSIVLNARLSPIAIVNDIIRAFQMGNFKQEIRFEAYANVNNFQIPINIKYQVG